MARRWDPAEVVHDDLTIVMAKLPENPPMLVPYGGLSYDAADAGALDRAIDFSKKPKKLGGRVRGPYADQYKPESAEIDAEDKSTWPADGIVLVAHEADDQLIWEPVEEGAQNKWIAVQGLRLVATGEGAGFIRFEPEKYPDPGAWRLTYREMKQAPAEGYEPILELFAADQRPLMRTSNTGRNVYFWFRTGDGRFGKGRVLSISAGEGSERVQVHGGGYVNPTPGDRDLNDGRKGWGEDPPEKAMEQPDYPPMTPK